MDNCSTYVPKIDTDFGLIFELFSNLNNCVVYMKRSSTKGLIVESGTHFPWTTSKSRCFHCSVGSAMFDRV